MKPMLLSSLGFREKISQLQLRGYILKINCLLMTVRTSEKGINTNMLSKLMFDRVIGNLYGSSVIAQKRCGCITRYTKISE